MTTLHVSTLLEILWVLSAIGGGYILVLRMFSRAWDGKLPGYWIDILLFVNLLVAIVLAVAFAFRMMDLKFVW